MRPPIGNAGTCKALFASTKQAHIRPQRFTVGRLVEGQTSLSEQELRRRHPTDWTIARVLYPIGSEMMTARHPLDHMQRPNRSWCHPSA